MPRPRARCRINAPSVALMVSHILSSLPRLRRALRRRRRTFAALLLCCLLAWTLPAVARAVGPGEPVTVAAADLPAGTEITAEHLTTVTLPRSSLRGEPPLEPDALVGRTVTRPVAEGSWLRASDLGADGGIVPPGQAAVTISTDPALVELISPGDDVIITTGSPESTEARTIRASVVSLSDASPAVAATGTGGATAVLAVPASEVDTIAISQHEGWVHIALIH